MALVFLIIGLLSAALPLILTSDEKFSLLPLFPRIMWIIVSIFYLIIVLYLGFKRAESNREAAEKLWDKVPGMKINQ
jgi:uncharacterized protein YacL